MIHDFRPGVIAFALCLLGAGTHLLPHDMGVSTVGAVGMLAAAYLPRRLALVPVLLTVLFVDALNGFYAVLAMSFVYLAHLAATAIAMPILRRRKAEQVVLAAVANAGVFYLVSNLTPMAMGFYPATAEGWLACYVNALPFLAKGILANLVFGGLAFGFVALIGQLHAHRLPAPQRD